MLGKGLVFVEEIRWTCLEANKMLPRIKKTRYGVLIEMLLRIKGTRLVVRAANKYLGIKNNKVILKLNYGSYDMLL